MEVLTHVVNANVVYYQNSPFFNGVLRIGTVLLGSNPILTLLYSSEKSIAHSTVSNLC